MSDDNLDCRSAMICDWFDAFLRTRRPRAELVACVGAADNERCLLARILQSRCPANCLVDEWLDRMTIELSIRCYGPFWPTADAVDAAAKSIQPKQEETGNQMASKTVEEHTLMLLEKHFRATRKELPRVGSPERTDALIKRGVLESERDAQFHLFTLSRAQRERASSQPPGRAELGSEERKRALG